MKTIKNIYDSVHKKKKEDNFEQELFKERMEEAIRLFDAHMDDCLYIMDLQKNYYRISGHATKRFMIPKEAFYQAQEEILTFVYQEDRALLLTDFEQILAGRKKTHNLHYRWLDKAGNPVWINCRGTILDDENGRPHYLIGCINETGNKQRADNISGLLGEIDFSSYINTNMDKLSNGFLMRVGIDDFSAINGDSGRDYGDYIIKKVAELIKECLLEGQKIFHIIAGEYMIVNLEEVPYEAVCSLYHNIREKILAFIDAENYKTVFTVSAGIIDGIEIAGDFNTIMRLTDFSLKQAKSLGSNSIYFFEPKDYEKFLRKRKLTSELYQAVDNGFEGFEVYYQPIVDCKTNLLLGAEALMRFSVQTENEEKSISPMEFIPLLEETGLILSVGKWILEEAFAMCEQMQQYIPGFRINVNVSYIQIVKGNILEDILSALKKSSLAPEYVGIELTESGYLDSNPHFLNLRNELKKNKINFIIDDFGTGYSNLHYLSNLSPNAIKIDQVFVNRAMTNHYDHELMVCIIKMAHSLNLTICVEGVEEMEVLEELRRLQVNYIQGYLFGKPYCKTKFLEKFVNNSFERRKDNDLSFHNSEADDAHRFLQMERKGGTE